MISLVAALLTQSLSPTAFEPVDVDRDARYELFRRTADGGVVVIGSTRGGELIDRTVELGLDVLGNVRAAEWTDVGEDGWSDLVVVSDEELVLYRSGEGGPFSSRPLFAPSEDEAVLAWQWVDLDGRNGLDLVVESTAGVRALFGSGDGRFDLVGSLPVPAPPAPDAVAARDAGAGSRVDPGSGPVAVPVRAAGVDPPGVELRGEAAPHRGASGEPQLQELTIGPGTTLAALKPRLLASLLFDDLCALTLRDQATGACLSASSIPMPGALYPLGTELFVDATGRVGLGTLAPSGARLQVEPDAAGNGVRVDTPVGGGVAIEAISSSVSDGFGVKAESNSPVGRAVRGVNEATTGSAIALDGVTRSNAGLAVSGIATSTSGTAVGVSGQTGADLGVGVLGRATHTTGATSGVRGETDSHVGHGVHGLAKNSTFLSGGVGVWGESHGENGTGVLGRTNHATGQTTGVRGESPSSTGTGVSGSTGNAGGFNFLPQGAGVFGTTNVSLQAGVVGLGDGTQVNGVNGVADGAGTGGPYFVTADTGVVGNSTADDGIGVSGFSQASSGAGIGVMGISSSVDGIGVSGDGPRLGVSGVTDGGVGVRGEAGVFGDLDGVGVHGTFGLDISVLGSGTSGSSDVAPGVTGWTESPNLHPGVLGVYDDGDLSYDWLQPSGVCGTVDVSDGAGVAGWNRVAGAEGAGVVGAAGAFPSFLQERPAGVLGTTNVASGVGVLGRNRFTEDPLEPGWGVMGLTRNPDLDVELNHTAGTVGIGHGGADVGVLAVSSGAGPGLVSRFSFAPSFNPIHSGEQGLVAISLSKTGTAADGVLGETRASNSSGVSGVWRGSSGVTPGSAAAGVTGRFIGNTPSANGFGVFGSHDGPGTGVHGECESAFGVGVEGVAGDFGTGVLGECGTGGFAVAGDAGASGQYGVYSIGDLGATGTKSFIHPHPTDPGKEIRYVALEGNEAGTYFRGTARLVGGTATIEVPADFRMVTVEVGLTVHLTPRGVPALLCVVEESLDRIVVAGEPDVEFHYLVQGRRRGYQDFETIRPNVSYVPRERGVPFGLQYPEEVRATLVATGILNPDLTPNEATAAAQGWTLRDPRPERPEFDPRISYDGVAAAPTPTANPSSRGARRGSAQRGHGTGERPVVHRRDSGARQ